MVWMASVKHCILWLHIGKEESLIVGIETVQTVVRKVQYVSVVKA